jgi:hypothetical protein
MFYAASLFGTLFFLLAGAVSDYESSANERGAAFGYHFSAADGWCDQASVHKIEY